MTPVSVQWGIFSHWENKTPNNPSCFLFLIYNNYVLLSA